MITYSFLENDNLNVQIYIPYPIVNYIYLKATPFIVVCYTAVLVSSRNAPPHFIAAHTDKIRQDNVLFGVLYNPKYIDFIQII